MRGACRWQAQSVKPPGSRVKNRVAAPGQSGALADVLIPEREGANGTGLMPLPFLLAVLNDAKTPAAIKLKVASATMPYTHPRQSTRPAKPSVATDRFGFTVEPALARKLRNEIARFSVLKKRRNPHPRDRETMQKLNEKILAKFATLQSPCPSCYSAQQAATDKEKIEYLWRKRRSRRKLTPDEDAALAHINARYCAFESGPEARARARLRVLKDKARIQRQANDRPLNPGEKCELHFLTILYPPEIPALNADHEAFLERKSIFSECPFDVGWVSRRLMIEHKPVLQPAFDVLRKAGLPDERALSFFVSASMWCRDFCNGSIATDADDPASGHVGFARKRRFFIEEAVLTRQEPLQAHLHLSVKRGVDRKKERLKSYALQ